MVINLEKLLKINTYTVSLLIYILVFSSINILYSFGFLGLFMFAAYRDYFSQIHIKRLYINILAILSLFAMSVRINITDLVIPVIETLLILLALKLLEDKKFRDYMQVYLLITLIFTGYSLVSMSLIFMVYLVLYLFLLNFSIIILTYYSEDKSVNITIDQLKTIFLKSSIIPIISLPLTFMFFFLIPRTNYPLLNILSSQSKGKTGFSDNVSLGEVSAIQEDNETVMRINMEYIGEIYIRGITFNSFDGKSWKNTIPDGLTVSRNLTSQKPLEYTAYLEPTFDNYLFTVDFPIGVNLGRFIKDYYPFLKKDLTIITTMPINGRVMYSGVSVIADRYKEETPVGYYLTLPRNLSPEIIEYSKRFKDDSNLNTAVNILKELYKFDYSLTDLPVGENQLEKFLFTKKKGNCEYFATAMAIILRLNNIPSRVVGGYRTATYNNIGKYYLVKQKDAHLWVEAYIDGYWIRFDPTPPVRNTVLNTIERPSKLKLLIDTINYYYNAFIINYDFSKQLKVYTGIKDRLLEIKNININASKNILKILIPIAVVGLITLLVYIIYRYSKIPYESRLLKSLLRKIKKYGYIKKDTEGLEEFCSKIKEEDLKEKTQAFIKKLEPYLYGDKRLTKEEYISLKQEIKRL